MPCDQIGHGPVVKEVQPHIRCKFRRILGQTQINAAIPDRHIDRKQTMIGLVKIRRWRRKGGGNQPTLHIISPPMIGAGDQRAVERFLRNLAQLGPAVATGVVKRGYPAIPGSGDHHGLSGNRDPRQGSGRKVFFAPGIDPFPPPDMFHLAPVPVGIEIGPRRQARRAMVQQRRLGRGFVF